MLETGHIGTRPYEGFSPKMPQNPLGMRIDPAPSDPWWSGPSPGVPGVTGDAGQRAVAEPLPAELRRRRLAEHDAAGLLETPHGRWIHVGHARLEDERPGHGPDVLRVVQVLDRERDAVERAARRALHEGLLGLARRRQGLVGRERAERVDHRVEPLDAIEHRARQLDGRELLRADQSGQLGRGREREVGGHDGGLPRYFFEMSQCPSARCGKPERSNVSTASSAEQTSGSPCKLNEVLSTAPIPVRRSNSRMTR